MMIDPDPLTRERLVQLRDRYWHLIAHRSEIAASGDFARLSWLGEDVVAYNDAGNVMVFDNICPHRGARFLLESLGNAPLVCRYHGWSYRNGKLRIAKKEDFAPCDTEQLDIGRLAVSWCGDFLFASVRPALELAAQLAGVFTLLADLSHEISSRFDFNAYLYECDWRTAVENALEPYHIDAIHAGTLSSLRLDAGQNEFFDLSSIWRAHILDERTDRRLKGMRRLFDLKSPFEGYQSIYLFPFSMVSSTHGFSHSLQNFFPGEVPRTTNFVSRLLVSAQRPGLPQDTLASFFESTAAFNRKVFDEDHEICKRVHPRIWEMQRRMPLARSEEKVAHFRSLLKRPC